MFIAATHNGISRLYETFGNGGSAEMRERILSPNDTSRTWYRQNPPLPRVMWSLRNNNNYQQTGLLVSLNYFATNKLTFLRNFYEKSKRSITKATTEGPAAYVLPSSDPRLGAQAEMLRVLQKQRVEVSRATEAFTVQVPVRRAPAAEGRGGRGGAGRRPRPRGRRRRGAGRPGRAADRATRVPGRQLHHPDGPAVFAHCRHVARPSVPGPRPIRSSGRTTTPAGRSRKGSTSRRFA